ncbi:hypothetical protein RND71_034888 [Anisodus tanguticus]|uniref:Uncharacterized protein n=1 Tax=Anisodus tanguticus TaxID=243964 RepID=A0AAE1R650_9SOLA|nr:hypothetical protein RND71_034888 [Anisodus tanguticus]
MLKQSFAIHSQIGTSSTAVDPLLAPGKIAKEEFANLCNPQPSFLEKPGVLRELLHVSQNLHKQMHGKLFDNVEEKVLQQLKVEWINKMECWRESVPTIVKVEEKVLQQLKVEWINKMECWRESVPTIVKVEGKVFQQLKVSGLAPTTSLHYPTSRSITSVLYRFWPTWAQLGPLLSVLECSPVSRLTTLGKPCVTGSTKKVYAGDRTRDLAVPRSTATPTWLPCGTEEAQGLLMDLEYKEARDLKTSLNHVGCFYPKFYLSNDQLLTR